MNGDPAFSGVQTRGGNLSTPEPNQHSWGTQGSPWLHWQLCLWKEFPIVLAPVHFGKGKARGFWHEIVKYIYWHKKKKLQC